MQFIILALLLAVGACEAVLRQKLTCPYEEKHEGLMRVWCKQNSTDCCTGLAFSQSARSVDGGELMVTQDLDSSSFTVGVTEPKHGRGVYWCGVLSRNGTIVKLAEGYFHSSFSDFLWSVTRWILLPLLPLVTTLTTFYTRTTTKYTFKEEYYDDIDVNRADPQYENTVSELEE